MGVVLLLVLVGLVFGGVGLFVEALRWLLVVAVVLLFAGFILGAAARGRRSPTT